MITELFGSKRETLLRGRTASFSSRLKDRRGFVSRLLCSAYRERADVISRNLFSRDERRKTGGYPRGVRHFFPSSSFPPNYHWKGSGSSLSESENSFGKIRPRKRLLSRRLRSAFRRGHIWKRRFKRHVRYYTRVALKFNTFHIFISTRRRFS